MKSAYMLAAVAVASIAVSGCATKRYTMATSLSEAEVALMDCDDLQLELVRADEVRRSISETAEMDWRSVAGFLGDYGIGNAMARGEAEEALNERVTSIRNAQASKGCLS